MDDVAVSGGNSASDSAAGPATFAEAFASDASPAPGTQDSSPTPAAEAAPPSDPGASPAATDRSPFIPRARFDEVNTKLNELKQWQEQHAWAAQIPRDQLQAMVQRFQQIHADPVTHVQELIAELQAHPTHGQTLRSLAARTLATRQQPAAEQMPAPDVSITDGQGNVVGQTYSAEQLARRDAFLRSQMLAEIRKEFAPVVETVQQVRDREAQAEAARQAETFSKDFYAELKGLAAFADVEPQIKADLIQLVQANQVTDEPTALRAATYQLYLKHALPKLTATAQSQLLDNLQQKAAASTSPNPGSAAPTTPKRVTSFSDPSLVW